MNHLKTITQAAGRIAWHVLGTTRRALARTDRDIGAALRHFQYNLPLWLVLPVSLGLHILLAFVFSVLPEGQGVAGIPVYQVKIIQAPAKPQASRTSAVREALSRLEVDAPKFRPPTAEALAAPDMENALADTPADEQDTGDPLPELTAPAADLTAPELPEPRPPKAAIPLPATPLPTATPVPTSLPPPIVAETPPLPEAPPRENLVAARGTTTGEKPADAARAPDLPTLEDQLRPRVEELRTRQADEPPPPPVRPRLPAAAPTIGTGEETTASNPLAALALRRYRAHIQGKVKDNYNYPADFPCGIVAEVQLVISDEGEVLAYELLRSSGNNRFDYAVELSVRRTVLDPPAAEIGLEVIRPRLRFKSKQCPFENY